MSLSPPAKFQPSDVESNGLDKFKFIFIFIFFYL